MQKCEEKQACLRLKKGKERPLLQGHHWIYSGAIADNSAKKGHALARVLAHDGSLLGTALLAASGQSIVAHLLARGEASIESTLSDAIASAISLRKRLFDSPITNAFRLINAEGDKIPGLIVDSYAGVLVLQISHPALEALKSQIVEELIRQIAPRAIYEKSTSSLRKTAGLVPVRGHLYGEILEQVEVVENGIRYSVDLLNGQKTGLFLDQREMRKQVFEMSSEKKVLNCFAYTGGFSIAALKGGATHVDSVEISAKCAPAIEQNLRLNELSRDKHRFVCEDVVDFVVREPLDYDVVILDPPAFAKNKASLDAAFKAYKDLNRTVIAKMPSGSVLLTFSCSYHIDEELFQNILFRASLEAGRNVRIIGRHRLALDHPVSIFHPESSYLKGLVLFID